MSQTPFTLNSLFKYIFNLAFPDYLFKILTHPSSHSIPHCLLPVVLFWLYLLCYHFLAMYLFTLLMPYFHVHSSLHLWCSSLCVHHWNLTYLSRPCSNAISFMRHSLIHLVKITLSSGIFILFFFVSCLHLPLLL